MGHKVYLKCYRHAEFGLVGQKTKKPSPHLDLETFLLSVHLKATLMKLPLPTNLALRNYYGCSYIKDGVLASKIIDHAKLRYSKDIKILDTYSNNLVWSTSLHNALKPQQHVLMESRREFVKHTQAHLATLSSNTMSLYPHDPFNWQSYLDLTEKERILTPEFQDRTHIHTNFLFTSNASDEGLIMQWLACLGHQNWILKYGNVKLLLWIPEASAIKISAPPCASARAKCSVVAQTFADLRIVALQNSPNIKKFNKNVLERDDPMIVSPTAFTGTTPMSLLEINPRDVEVNDMFSWDYVTKNLMISKTMSVSEAVRNLGPGAEEYFTQKISTDKLKRRVKDLESVDFLEVVKVFDDWPFKPETLFDFLVHERGN